MEAPLVNWMETGTTILCTELDWLNGVAGPKSTDKAPSGDGEHAEPPCDLESDISHTMALVAPIAIALAVNCLLDACRGMKRLSRACHAHSPSSLTFRIIKTCAVLVDIRMNMDALDVAGMTG